MCGIVGLFLKNKALAPELGSLTAKMLKMMSDRGPDSAGFAVYGAGEDDEIKLTLRIAGATGAFAAAFAARFGLPARLTQKSSHAVISIPAALEAEVRLWLAGEYPGIHLVGAGTRMELYKDVGLPGDVADRFGLPAMRAPTPSATPAWRRNPPSPPTGRIPSRPASTNAWCITARSPTTTPCAGC